MLLEVPWQCRGQPWSGVAATGSHNAELKRDKVGLHRLLPPRLGLIKKGCRDSQPAKQHWCCDSGWQECGAMPGADSRHDSTCCWLMGLCRS